METRAFTPARIVALAIIAVLIGGLAYLRIASAPDPVSVPEGARAGDLSLAPCTYPTADGDYPADCGTLVVPENRASPRSRLIALPVTRIRARSDSPAEPVFHLDGGPGKSNLDFPTANRLADDHDVVLVGYRGVDGSSVLDCPEVSSALKHSADLLGEESFRDVANSFRTCAERLTGAGVDLAGYSVPQLVEDLEAARRALGYGRVNLLSESAGTRTAMIYSWKYPDSIHRSVMIGVNPPGHFLWDPAVTDEQLRLYAELCAQDADCRNRTEDLVGSIRRTSAQLPDRWLFLPIRPGNVRVASFFGLHESTSAAAISGPMTLDAWLSAEGGDPSGFWFMSLAAGLLFPDSFTWGEWAAMGISDAKAAARYFTAEARQRDSILGNPGTEFTWAGGELAHAWPAAPDAGEYDRVRTSEVETLLIGGTLDFSAPPKAATEELLPALPNGHQVVLAGIGHTTDFWFYQPEAGRHLINTFLDSGRVDDSLYQRARVDFTPSTTWPGLAKIVAGTLIGIPLLMVASLVGMGFRVRRRGGFGPRASAVLRSVYPVLLGLGGWFLAVLIVLTALPTVPVDNELLAAISVGIPTGLGIYLAWVHRDRPANLRSIGLAAAGAGALVGAWLGFHATEGLFALLTAIVGAIVGANLTLLTLDLARRRPKYRRRSGAGLPPNALFTGDSLNGSEEMDTAR